MSNEIDPNTLAWKGTPGPWKVADTYDQYNENEPQIVIWDGDEQASGPICDMGEIGDMNYAEAVANAHMISAAPEAIEFIADLVYALSNGDDYLVVEMIPRAEEILKKAYNH